MYDFGPGKQDWKQAGLPTEGREANEVRAHAVARADAPTCGLEDRVGEVASRVREAGWDTCVVVNDTRVVLGLLREDQLAGDPDAAAGDVMRPGPGTYRADVPVHELAPLMARHDLASVPITTPEGILLGVLRRADAEREAHREHEEDADD